MYLFKQLKKLGRNYKNKYHRLLETSTKSDAAGGSAETKATATTEPAVGE